jgi:predicted nucleic acid-binding protein
VNIILDFYLNRNSASKEIILKAVYGAYKAHLSINMLTDIYYILEKNSKDARAEVEKLLNIFQVLDVTKANCLQALSIDIPDFEDALVTAVAKSHLIDIIVTQNEVNFVNSGLIVYTPEEFLQRLKG